MKALRSLALLGFLYLPVTAPAQEATTCTGLLLQRQVSVRAEGMGSAQAAAAVDAAGAHDYNPAGLAGGRYPRLSAALSNGLVNDVFGVVAGDWRYGTWNFGGSMVYFDAGSMDIVSYDGSVSQVSAQRDFLLSGTAARHIKILQQNLAVGGSLKLLYSNLVEEYSAFGAAIDLGTRYELKPLAERLFAGAAIKNLGLPMKYDERADPLPVMAIAGLTYDFKPEPNVNLLLAADAQYDLNDKWRGQAGIQVLLFDLLALRGGYKTGYDLGDITAGAGVVWQNISLDYSFSFLETFNSLHRISVGYEFAPKPARTGPRAEEPMAGPEETVSRMASDMDVAPRPEYSAEKMNAQVLELRRKGGVVNEVVLDKGAVQGIKPGFPGSLLDTNGRSIAGLVVRVVDQEICLAEVVGLSKDIGNDVSAVLEVPKGK